MYTFEIASEQHRDRLVTLYYRDIEKHQGRAQKFADDLIRKFNTILNISNDSITGTLSWDVRGGLDDGVLELTAMGVSDEFRRQGIGRALVGHMIETARPQFTEANSKLRIIYLFMENGNETARRFYKSLGFTEQCNLSEFYPHDDAALWVLRVE